MNKNKNHIFIVVFVLFINILLLIGCNSNQIDTSAFELASNLDINPELDGFVTMDVRLSDDQEILTANITNLSDIDIVPIHPIIEYFDGENWRISPWSPSFEDEGYESILSNTNFEKSIFLAADELLPESGLFRLRVQIHSVPDSGTSVENRTSNHDLVAEFRIEE